MHIYYKPEMGEMKEIIPGRFVIFNVPADDGFFEIVVLDAPMGDFEVDRSINMRLYLALWFFIYIY